MGFVVQGTGPSLKGSGKLSWLRGATPGIVWAENIIRIIGALQQLLGSAATSQALHGGEGEEQWFGVRSYQISWVVFLLLSCVDVDHLSLLGLLLWGVRGAVKGMNMGYSYPSSLFLCQSYSQDGAGIPVAQWEWVSGHLGDAGVDVV